MHPRDASRLSHSLSRNQTSEPPPHNLETHLLHSCRLLPGRCGSCGGGEEGGGGDGVRRERRGCRGCSGGKASGTHLPRRCHHDVRGDVSRGGGCSGRLRLLGVRWIWRRRLCVAPLFSFLSLHPSFPNSQRSFTSFFHDETVSSNNKKRQCIFPRKSRL